MIFTPLRLHGAFLVESEHARDERGSFARVFCRDQFARHGIAADFPQCSISQNRRAGTLRGLHFQAEPFAEAKLVRCIRGAIYDVIVDLRADSPTYAQWEATTLDEETGGALYVPPGFAHGFQALRDDTSILYHITVPYVPKAGCGIRWNDPALAIPWPLADPILSDRDAMLPSLEDLRPEKGHYRHDRSASLQTTCHS
jgi:dTDP-4-dehydrorhamnose 3,5-epimerase